MYERDLSPSSFDLSINFYPNIPVTMSNQIVLKQALKWAFGELCRPYFFGLKNWLQERLGAWNWKKKNVKNFRTYNSYRQKTKDQNDLRVIDSYSFPLFNIPFHLKEQWGNFGPPQCITLDLQNLRTKGKIFFKY